MYFKERWLTVDFDSLVSNLRNYIKRNKKDYKSNENMKLRNKSVY